MPRFHLVSRALSVSSLLLFFLIQGFFAQTAIYGVEDVAPGQSQGDWYFPKKINADGVVTGYKGVPGVGQGTVAQFWAGGIERPAGDLRSLGYDLTNDSIVVGRGFQFSTGLTKAYWYDPSALLVQWLPCPVFGPNGAFCEAYAINESRLIVGSSDPRSLFPQGNGAVSRALKWSSNVATEIFPGNTAVSVANDVNESGTIVGMLGYRPFIKHSNGGLTLLGGTMVSAQAVNDLGHVVGSHTLHPAWGFPQRAYYWNGSSDIDIGHLGVIEAPGQSKPAVAAYDINNQNQVVGGAAVGFDQNGVLVTHAFIWDPQNGMRDLNTLIPPNSGIILTDATGINDSGEIAASGYVAGSNPSPERAYLLKEPKAPLIFIPGVAGSSLYEVDSNGDPIIHQLPSLEVSAIWPSGLMAPAALGLSKLYLDPESAPHRNIVAVDSLEQITPLIKIYKPLFDHLQGNGYVRYETGLNPKKRRVGLGPQYCSGEEIYGGQKPNLFVFAYDWRKTNVEAADQLSEYIECVQRFHPNQKVNILTHSMGGLIARRYILDNQNDQRVDKLITTVAPFLGAPKAIDVLYNGRFIGKYDYYFRRSTIRRVTSYSKGAHELLPSEWYFDLDQKPFAYKSLFLGLETDYPYADTKRVLNAKFASRPYDAGEVFHAGADNARLLDNWSADSSGVKFYHLYGVQAWNSTPGKVIELPFGGITPAERKFGVVVEKTGGDGTVPTVSARRAAEGLNSFLTTPSAIVKRCESPSYSDDGNYEHGGILKNPIIFNEIRAILNNSVLDQDECERDDMNPNLTRRNRTNKSSASVNTISVNTLSVYGVDRLEMTDIDGNSNTTISDGVDQAVPDIDYEYGSETSDPFIAPHEVTFAAGKGVDIKFIAPAGPVRIELRQGTSNQINSQVIKYLDLQLPLGVTAWIKFNQGSQPPPGSLTSEVENLRYDADGDGTFETEVQPSIVLSGADANDKTLPTIDISHTVNNGVATVTASATDAQTGIRQIRYIVHGEENDHLYTSPFTVDVSQSRLIYVNAEDNAGNRSVLARWLDAAAPTTTFAQVPEANSDGWSNSYVSVELKAKDDVGGSGVESLTFSASGAQTIAEETIDRYYDPFVFPEPASATDSLTQNLNITAEGVTNIIFHAKDRAGNTESQKSLSVKVDRSIPSASHSLTQSGQQSTITITANDEVSGIKEIIYSLNGGASQVYSAPLTMATNSNTIISYSAKDFAGNESLPQTVTISSASIGGRVVDQLGRPIRSATVRVADSGGSVIGTATTNTFGYYSVGTVAIGQTYTVTTTARQYTFTPRTLFVFEDVTGFDFIALP